jgi:hypothetical protein
MSDKKYTSTDVLKEEFYNEFENFDNLILLPNLTSLYNIPIISKYLSNRLKDKDSVNISVNLLNLKRYGFYSIDNTKFAYFVIKRLLKNKVRENEFLFFLKPITDKSTYTSKTLKKDFAELIISKSDNFTSFKELDDYIILLLKQKLYKELFTFLMNYVSVYLRGEIPNCSKLIELFTFIKSEKNKKRKELLTKLLKKYTECDKLKRKFKDKKAKKLK